MMFLREKTIPRKKEVKKMIYFADYDGFVVKYLIMDKESCIRLWETDV